MQQIVNVGIMSAKKIEFFLYGDYRSGDEIVRGEVSISSEEFDGPVDFVPVHAGNYVEVSDVTIGVNFHWQRRETQRFRGSIRVVKDGDDFVLINSIGVEDYLTSVISSEMSATSSLELLKAHAVISRSWVLAQIEKGGEEIPCKAYKSDSSHYSRNEHIIWYDHDDHTLFDVCADDHCQRYQGITRASTPEVSAAVEATRSEVLVSEGKLCDARFSKCCGGVMEQFENCWADSPKPYLVARADTPTPMDFPDLTKEEEARKWILTSPGAFCNTSETRVLRQVLNNYDQETADFYRWSVTYSTDGLSRLVARKSGIDFGRLIDLIPLQRGTSGRIVRLRIIGEKATVDVGKELEIRRWLSESHLYSSAFIVEKIPDGFRLRGAGWGHGVGLCQIGAAVMADKGYGYREILAHYYPGSIIVKNYNRQ